jgi:hypothetical protein
MLRATLLAILGLTVAHGAVGQTPDYSKLGTPTISGYFHIEGQQSDGDRVFIGGQRAGSKGHSLRLEGFALSLSDTKGALHLEYMCHLEFLGDQIRSEGQFCGSRGVRRRLEAFSISLHGPAAQFFKVEYQCHLERVGDSPVTTDGQLCGSRGNSARLEAMLVRIVRSDRK